MNDTLTTLIAFVGFLIVFSSLVQSFQEGLKNLFKLKTRVWERFFVNLYQIEFSLGVPKEAPTPPKTFGLKSELSAEKPKKKDSVGEFDIRMKRINDVVIRAHRLLKDMKTTLYEIKDIDLKTADSKTLLEKVDKFRDDLEEVVGLKLDGLLNIYDKFIKTNISNFYNNEDLKKFLNQYPDLRDELKDLKATALADLKKTCSQLLKQILEFERTIGQYRLQIENKMDSWIAKVEEEYKRNMLKWTVIIGAAFVLIFNADTFNIYKYLSVDSKARAALVERAAATTAITQKAKPDKLNAIELALKENNANVAKELIENQLQDLEVDFSGYKAQDKLQEIRDLKKQVKEISIAEKDKALDLLKRNSGGVSRLYLELQKKSLDYQLEGLYAINLPVGWLADLKVFRAVPLGGKQRLILIFKKIGGLIITIFLITFGAPFWNDILNALVGITKTTFKKG
jgi:predicted DNA-binding protein